MNKKRFATVIRLYAFFFFITLECLLPIKSTAQKTTTEKGPFEPFGGKREITFNKDNVPIELKKYDTKDNIRKHTVINRDNQNRIIFMADSVFDEEKHFTKGSYKTVTYKNDLDYGGKTNYNQYNPKTKKFVIVRPLVSTYEHAMLTTPPDSLKLNSFYKKYTDANGIPIVASTKTPDKALLIARDIVNYMLMKRFDIREELIRTNSRVLVMAETEMETDLPERSDWKKPALDDPRLTPDERENYHKPNGIGTMSDKQYWNQRARGMGGNEVSCAEENLLGYAGTKYYGENILVHEFSHNMMNALSTVDTLLFSEILKAYEAAKSGGLYKGQYAINTVAEYWAEGTQWWFWSNIEFYDGKVRIQSPDDLKIYDPTLYHIFERVYAGHRIPADVYYGLNLNPVR